ncbi:MAG: ACT domain-containing protein [Acidimicrobiia bacterium]
MRVERRLGVFLYVSRARGEAPLAGAVATVDEGDSVTYIVAADGAPADATFPWAWLTVSAETALQAVGITAAFSAALAAHGIAANVLAGFHHDHVLVPVERADEAIVVLSRLQP